MANFLGTAFHSLWGYLASDHSSPSQATPTPAPEQKDPPLNPPTTPHPPPPSSAEPPPETTEQPSEPTMPPSPDIPWREIYTTHISQLRGHLKYLILLSTHPSAKNKLTQQITTTKTLIASATAAAKLAGITIDDATRTTKRKSRLSVTFAELDEVLGKKVKMRHSKGNKGLRKPSAEAMAGLKSRLGKRGREEEEEEGEEGGVKRSRVTYLQKGDPVGEYEDDDEGKEEEKEEEEEEPAPAASVPEVEKGSDTPAEAGSSDIPEAKDATPATGKRTKTTTPAHETPKSAKKVKTTNTPTPASTRTRSQSTPSTQTRPIDDEATPKPAKKQKQNPKSPKHTTEGSAGGEAKKQKKDR